MIALPEVVTSAIDSCLDVVYSFEPVFAPTVVLVPDVVRSGVEKLSEAVGFDVETLGYVLALLLCYPLGMIMNALPYGNARHFFSFLLGAFILQFTTGVQWIHQMITALVAYTMFLLLPRKWNTYLVPTFVMVYISLGHLHRQYINYLGWDLDFTGAQMVLTQKLYMMAYNLYDGEVLSKGIENRAAKKCSRFAMQKVPSLLEFLGYTFCFSNVLAGPAYEFSTYVAVCDGSLFHTKDGKPRGKVPSNIWPTLKPFLVSLVCMGIFVGLGAQYPLLDPEDPQKNLPVLLQPQVLELPWLQRFIYMWIALFALRQKYYFGWKNAEGASNIWYAGFDGFDEKGNAKGWENSNNVDILDFELAPNMSTLSRSWNKKTSLWLNRYVYIRTNGSLLAVYALSAFWHGFYPGYYLFFLSVPLITFCERLAKKKISPRFPPGKWTPYGILGMVMTSIAAEYLVSAFAVLAFDRSWALWTSHFFFVHACAVLFYVVLLQIPTPKVKEV